MLWRSRVSPLQPAARGCEHGIGLANELIANELTAIEPARTRSNRLEGLTRITHPYGQELHPLWPARKAVAIIGLNND